MRDYDDMVINGEWHRCACGAQWSDSDGGPCHARCAMCGEVNSLDDDYRDGGDTCDVCRRIRYVERHEAVIVWTPRALLGSTVQTIARIPLCVWCLERQAVAIGDTEELPDQVEIIPCKICMENFE